MDDCGAHRGRDCACPANLHNLPPPIEAVDLGNVTVIRVDEGFTERRMVPSPQNNARLVEQERFIQPRWICTTCGWAIRGPGVHSHECDETYLLWKERPISVALTLPPEKRYGGAFRFTIWRDADGVYHLSEVVIAGDRLIKDQKVLEESFYPSLEGALSDCIVREFTP